VNAADRFREAVKVRNVDAMIANLAPDVRLFNPTSPEPFVGRERAGMIFKVLDDVFDEFEHTHILSGGPAGDLPAGTSHAVVFRARVGETEVQGVDVLEVNQQDQIATFTVMVRPLDGMNALIEAITARLEPARALARKQQRTMAAPGPNLNQVNFVSRDVAAAAAFYRRLGLPLDAKPGAEHLGVTLASGMILEFDSTEFAPQWNTGCKAAARDGVVLGFTFPSRRAVDDSYADLTEAGYRPLQPPYDAFWGARYAIVADLDGNSVGLMSSVEESRRFWPPAAPPSL